MVIMLYMELAVPGRTATSLFNRKMNDELPNRETFTTLTGGDGLDRAVEAGV